MRWRYTLIQSDGTSTTIADEPIGWDTISQTLQRDADWHGIHYNFSAGTLQFHDDAYWLIKHEYLINGIDGFMGIRIEWKCDDCTDYELHSDGKLNFQRYREYCGDDCYITCGFDESSKAVLLKNRQDIAVNLSAQESYDGVTTLVNYNALSLPIKVPSRSIFLRSHVNTINDNNVASYSLLQDADWRLPLGEFGTVYNDGYILPKFNNTTEEGLEVITPQFQFDYIRGSDLTNSEIFTVSNANGLQIRNRYKLSAKLNGAIHLLHRGGFDASRTLQIKLSVAVKYGNPNGTLLYALSPYELLNYNQYALPGQTKEQTIPFTFTWTGEIEMSAQEKVYLYFVLNEFDNYGLFALDISMDDACFFEVSSASRTIATTTKASLVHETGARIIESITDSQLSFKSYYYGRTDSEPLAYPSDGAGALRAFTNGLQLRNAILQDGSLPAPAMTFKDFFAAQNAIDCIGIGIENNVVRMEPVRYFYQDTIVFVADEIDEVMKDVKGDRLWNQFKFGFDKFETESTNGLDALHTKRDYRLPLANADQTLEQICSYIYDGYAIEETRRRGGSTEDWRYDQNIFGLCLRRGVETLYEVEQGNVIGGENVLDPSTIINYRVTPVRNAMRWFAWLLQGVRRLTGDKAMLFNAGEGNYVAKGMLADDEPSRLEAATVAENMAISLNSFADSYVGQPFIVPETVTFTYPLGLNEFMALKRNMYGRVQYRRSAADPWQYGWIDKLEPDHEDGTAKFTLITSFREGQPLSNIKGLAAENLQLLIDEDNKIILVEP